jgi:hypothetical protein
MVLHHRAIGAAVEKLELPLRDMCEVGKPARRSKAAVMESLKDALGTMKLPQLNRERLIEFGRKRVNQGAGRHYVTASTRMRFSVHTGAENHAPGLRGPNYYADLCSIQVERTSRRSYVGARNSPCSQPAVVRDFIGSANSIAR